MSQNYAIVIL